TPSPMRRTCDARSRQRAARSTPITRSGGRWTHSSPPARRNATAPTSSSALADRAPLRNDLPPHFAGRKDDPLAGVGIGPFREVVRLPALPAHVVAATVNVQEAFTGADEILIAAREATG